AGQHQHGIGRATGGAARHRRQDSAAHRRSPAEERSLQEGGRAAEREGHRREELPEAQADGNGRIGQGRSARRQVNPRMAPGGLPGASPSQGRRHSVAGSYWRGRGGYTLIEMLFVVSVLTTVTAIAVPATREAIDALRAAMAARSLSARLMHARIDAIKRSAAVALRFEPAGTGYRVTPVLPGHGTGVPTRRNLSRACAACRLPPRPTAP